MLTTVYDVNFNFNSFKAIPGLYFYVLFKKQEYRAFMLET
jgi:hypothetical protein